MKRSKGESPERLDRAKLGGLNGFEDLLFQGGEAVIPEEERSYPPVDERRRVAASLAARDSGRDRRPSENARSRSWQQEQEMEPSRERQRSKNSRRNAIFSLGSALSSGTGK